MCSTFLCMCFKKLQSLGLKPIGEYLFKGPNGMIYESDHVLEILFGKLPIVTTIQSLMRLNLVVLIV